MLIRYRSTVSCKALSRRGEEHGLVLFISLLVKNELMQVALPQFMREDRVEGNRNGTDQVVKMAILYSNLNSFGTVYTSNRVTFLVCQPCGPGSHCGIAALAFMMFWIPID